MLKMPTGNSHRPKLSSSSSLDLISPSASSGWAGPDAAPTAPPWGKKVLGAKQGLLQAPPGTKREMQIVARSRGERHWRGLWEPLYLIWFSLFKNKLQSSGRGEVGGNACAGGEGGRAGQRPAARKTTSHHSPRARKKAVEHPHGQEAPEPGKSRRQRLRRPSSCHGPPALHIDGAGSTPLHQAPLSWGHFSKIYRRRERGKMGPKQGTAGTRTGLKCPRATRASQPVQSP